MKNTLFGCLLCFSLIGCQTIEIDSLPKQYPGTGKTIPDPEIFPEVPIWSGFSKMFIYAPILSFDSIAGAHEYLFNLTQNEAKFFVKSKTPSTSFGEVWERIPHGIVEIEAYGLDEEGNKISTPQYRKIYRAVPFSGEVNAPAKPYKQAAFDALNYIYHLDHVQQWLDTGKPDLYYSLYGYPAKIISSLVNGMLMYSGLSETTQEDSLKAMEIATAMMNHLIDISKSEHSDLKAFPPTYDMDFVNERMKVKNIPNENGVNDVATANANKLMMLYGYEYAGVLLNMYDRTGEEFYLERAKSIAESYKKLQLPDGNWPLNIHYHTTKPVDHSMMMPTKLMLFLQRLQNDYAATGFDEVIKKGNHWVQNNPMKTFFWEAQFEDVPTYDERYHNLSKYPPTNYAIYLLENHFNEDNLKKAKELVRFAEDQFVIWENPPNDSILFNPWAAKDTIKWQTPCVLEQYHFYVPVDASACQMITAYKTLYKYTKEEEYLQKATALANSITHAQQENGEITTVWTKSGFETENWLNCMVFSAKTLMEFGE